jgi:hypothetical protein
MVSESLQQQIDDLEVEGWDLHEEQGDDRAVMVKRKTGGLVAHLIIFVVAGWWTFGFANAVYLAYKYFFDADKRVVRPGDQ